MHHSCVASSISLGARGWYSYSFNDNPRCCPSRSCCYCCCNSTCRVPIDPNYCYGLRQSSLIQWSSCRKLVLGSYDPCFHTRVSVYGGARSCCAERQGKVYSLGERRGSGRSERLRKIMVFKERIERDVDEIVDEAEIMLSFLADTVDGETLHLTRERRRVSRMNIEEGEEESNRNIRSRHLNKTKRADSVVSKDDLTGYSKQEEQALLQKENKRRIQETGCSSSLLVSGRADEKKEKGILIREMSQRNNEKEDEEEEEEMEFVKEKRRHSRKDGSSCSSYYSLSSKSDHEGDEEIQHRQQEYLNDSSISSEGDSRSNQVVLKGKVDTLHEDRREEYGMSVSMESSDKQFYAGSSSVESNFRKKSEKKLTDVSVEERESRQKVSQKESRHSIDQEMNYEKFSYDDRKDKSTRTMRLNEEKNQQQSQSQTNNVVSVDTERSMKYKQLVNVHETENVDIRSSQVFQKNSVHEKNNVSAKDSTSSHKQVGETQNVVAIDIKDEHNFNSIHVVELSKTQKTDLRNASIYHQSYETNSSKEENYATSSSSQNDAKKQQIEFEQVSGMMVSGKKARSKSEVQHDSYLKQFDQVMKQKEKVDLAYGSNVELEELHSPEYAEHKETAQSVIGSGEKTKISIQLNKQDVEGGERGDFSGEVASMLIFQEDNSESAGRVEKSSTGYVSEYDTQVSHETLSSESEKETKTKTKTGALEISHEDEQLQQSIVPPASGDSQSEKRYSGGDDSSSGVEGPSVEMWKVQESSRLTEVVQDDEVKTGSELAKRSGKSLWNILGDFFRLKWVQQSDGQHSGRKSERRSPQTQSVNSEAWFSSHEVEETGEADREKGGSTARHQQEKNQFRVDEESSFSASDDTRHRHEKAKSQVSEGPLKIKEPATTKSPAIIGSLPSPGAVAGTSVGVSSPGVIIDSSTPSPSSRVQKSPLVQESVDTGEASASDNGTRRLSTGSLVDTKPTENEEKLKRGMLRRADQIQRDRFDEWEEAYKLETEQRKIDEMFMREALLEAQKAADHWEVPVGAVLVHKGEIIARGCNLVEELRDSTAHAEMICIRQASNLLRTWRLSETVLYVTLEPCPMCAGAILQARIDTVVWGAPNKLLGADGSWIRLFPNAGSSLEQSDKPPAPIHPFHPKIAVRRGVLGSECADTMQQFFKLRRKKKDVKAGPPSPRTSCLPVPHRHSSILTKMHHAFSVMFP